MAAKQYFSVKKKESAKKELPKSYARLKDLASKARVEVEKILRIIGKEADLSSKVLKGRVDVLNLDTKIEKKYREMGKETYTLIEEEKITDTKLKSIAVEIDKLYRALEQKKKQINRLKQDMKKVAKSS